MTYMDINTCTRFKPTPCAPLPPTFASFLSAAAFGPNVLSVEPPVESRPLVKARPRDGCSPLLTSMDNRAIALVERGSCNFTQKVFMRERTAFSSFGVMVFFVFLCTHYL